MRLWVYVQTYIVSNQGKFKFSSKGVNKQHVKNPLAVFREVLELGKSGKGKNIGFRVRDNMMHTYTQEKNAFSYLYCKRKVLDDGIETEPLDIILTPSKKQKQKNNGVS